MSISKPIIFLLLFLGATSKILTQEYWQFVPNGYKYIEKRSYLAAMSDPGSQYYYEYLVDGDTSIGDKKYQIVKGRNIARISYSTEGFVSSLNGYINVGGLRKDSSKIYFRLFEPIPENYYFQEPVNTLFEQNQDQIIYDFSIEIGDTVNWKTVGRNVVESIDTISLDNSENKKRIIFYYEPLWSPSDDFWIEEIGSARGLLGTMIRYPSGHWGPHYQLHCISNIENDERIYNRLSEMICSELLEGDFEEEEEEEEEEQMEECNRVMIYPNITSNFIKIELPESNEEAKIEIFDMQGRRMLKLNNITCKMEIDISRLSAGFYILQIDFMNEKNVRKIFKR